MYLVINSYYVRNFCNVVCGSVIKKKYYVARIRLRQGNTILQLIVIEIKNDVFNQLAWSHPEQNNVIILIFPRCYILLSCVTAITLLLVFYCCI